VAICQGDFRLWPVSWKAQVPFPDPDILFDSHVFPDVGLSPHVLKEGDLVILEYLPTRMRESLQDRKKGVRMWRPSIFTILI